MGSLSFWLPSKACFLREIPLCFLGVRLQDVGLFLDLYWHIDSVSGHLKKIKRNQYYIASKNNCLYNSILEWQPWRVLAAPSVAWWQAIWSPVMLQPDDCLLCLLVLWPSTSHDSLQKMRLCQNSWETRWILLWFVQNQQKCLRGTGHIKIVCFTG